MEFLGRDFWLASNLFAGLFLGLVLCGGEGVRIKDMRVPDILLNGTERSAVLDCEYTLDIPASKAGLVVKWFFNNHPAPVYQWIYNNRPQYLGVLKNRVNLNYRATEDEATMYRGFEITSPTVELSGEYKCLVSTFDQEDSRSKKMVVYAPEKSLEVVQEKPTDSSVQINCTADGLYPEPNITILADGVEKCCLQVTTTKLSRNSSLFQISGSLLIDDQELNDPTTFECLVSIPEAKYSNRRKLVYFPGPPTTPSVLEANADSMASATSISPSYLGMLLVSLIAITSSVL